MKCLYCEKEFKLIPFGKSGGSNRNFCYNCLPISLGKSDREKRTQELLNHKARQQKMLIGCQRCGYNKNGSALEWHHLDPNEKDGDPSLFLGLGSQEGWQLYQEEISKCILLCANCHREEHFPNKEIKQFNGEQEILDSHKPILDEYAKTNSISQTANNLSLGTTYVTNVIKYHQIGINSVYEGIDIVMIDKVTGAILKEFKSINEASRYILNNDSGNGHINEVCKGKRKSAYGYLWKYKKDI